ncbi:hypothetical protein NPIL_282451 [Nephila pilipes]|uniref:Uncharacterized protein n=1 Tax=Nephila pilipes TaxID=299642 RepID=A0A8X6N0H4_NEPPI|nr:hypothetical protein NPIL_282451 [Nephila pilipes]
MPWMWHQFNEISAVRTAEQSGQSVENWTKSCKMLNNELQFCLRNVSLRQFIWRIPEKHYHPTIRREEDSFGELWLTGFEWDNDQ